MKSNVPKKPFNHPATELAKGVIDAMENGCFGDVPENIALELREFWNELASAFTRRAEGDHSSNQISCPGCKNLLLPIGGFCLHSMPDGSAVPYFVCTSCWSVIENGSDQEKNRLNEAITFYIESVLIMGDNNDDPLH